MNRQGSVAERGKSELELTAEYMNVWLAEFSTACKQLFLGFVLRIQIGVSCGGCRTYSSASFLKNPCVRRIVCRFRCAMMFSGLCVCWTRVATELAMRPFHNVLYGIHD